MLEKKIERRIRLLERKSGLRFLDEVAFIRSWIDKPITMGAVTPSGKVLARAMARPVDLDIPGPVVELGPGTGAVTKALVEHGVEPSRLVLVEFNPAFCRLLRTRYPEATVIQGDAYRIQHLLSGLLKEPAAAVVSGLPLQTKPFKRRVTLIDEAFELMAPGAPFIQFTYAMVTPIPKRASAPEITAHASELIWQNLPPARVWVYRKS
jgi:phosphatidylethanolamine/phosphatidyl-N-methylethanolamine N-methyltransferase